MKQFLLTAVVAGLTLLGATRSNAILFTDLDVIEQKLDAAGNSTYASTFNILDDGFVPGYHNIWGAGITFWLADDGDAASESFTINLDGAHSSSQYTGFLFFGNTLIGIDMLASLNADGILTYSVEATSGDFWLKTALLIAGANVGPSLSGQTQPVPDAGGSIILIVLGLISLLVMRRYIQVRC